MAMSEDADEGLLLRLDPGIIISDCQIDSNDPRYLTSLSIIDLKIFRSCN